MGPQLGLVKSSSLESLHNVMAHSINRGDLVDDGSDLRNRSTRNSFRRAVDHSYDNGSERQVDEVEGQRGVDGESLEKKGLKFTLVTYNHIIACVKMLVW